ncbi:MAG: hypothetical protein ACRERD_23450, partial [Candidatus Binatia bacterium]
AQMYTLKLVGVYFLLYVLIVIFSCVSEITYKKKSSEEVWANLNVILRNSFFAVLVLLIASFVHQQMGCSNLGR